MRAAYAISGDAYAKKQNENHKSNIKKIAIIAACRLTKFALFTTVKDL